MTGAWLLKEQTDVYQTRWPVAVAMRAICFILGLGAISWSLSVIGPLWQSSALDHVANRIIQMEAFRSPALRTLAAESSVSSSDGRARPETQREWAIVNERLLEQSLLEGRRTTTDLQLDVTAGAIERALTATPSDSFLWLMLYWVRTVKSGFSGANLPLLRMSYLTGPNEGWIALRRNRLAFIVEKFLPSDLLDRTCTEFVTLMGSGFVDDAAEIFTGPAWGRRDLLLVRIENLPIDLKQRFARKVYDLGYDVTVPGVARFGERPWR